MGVDILLLLLLWGYLVGICTATCRIQPNENGHVTIPDNVTSIDSNAFQSCSELQSVTIGESVTSIGDQAFQKCSKLKSVTIPDSVTSIGDNAFQSCSELQSVTIPDNVTSLGKSAFFGCITLQSVTIGDGVTSIGDKTFEGCSALQSVTIGESVTSIGQNAFFKCNALQSVVIPDSVTTIVRNAFQDCNALQSVTIGESVTSIGQNAFFKCNALQSVTIGESVTSIGDRAFFGCSSLQSVVIPDSVTNIGQSAFYKCSALQSVTIGESVTSIGDKAFAYCNALRSVTIPDSVTSVGMQAFATCVYGSGTDDCNPYSLLRVVTIGCNASLSLGEFAFYLKGNLTSISFGTSQHVNVDSGAFTGCSKLQSVYFNKSVQSIFGLPDHLAKSYLCKDAKCGCNFGYGNARDDQPDLFRCEACPAGRATGGPHDACQNCKIGTYTSQNGTAVCTLCPRGRYGISEGGISADVACKNCSSGSFAPADGSDTCSACPPGTVCEDEGMKRYYLCSPGTYNQYSNQTQCVNCPVGRYQPLEGSAVCEPCDAGKYLNLIGRGGTSASECAACEAGKFASSVGSSSCTQCPDAHYTSEVGQTECKRCPGIRETNTPDFTACQLDDKLLVSQSSLVDSMFKDGWALYGSASIAVAFVLACAAMQLQKESWSDKVGQIGRLQVLLKSLIPGFSFGSEVFLIFAIWSEENRRALAVVMLLFRLLHPLGVLFVLLSMFGGEETRATLSGVIEGATKWSKYFNADFSRDKTPFVGLILLISMADVSLVQMLPWNKGIFHTESKGFPCLSLLEFCLGLDAIQASVSVMCQIIYLGLNSTVNDATTSPQAKAVFSLNIVISIVGVVMGLLMLYLKDNLMKTVKHKSIVLGEVGDSRSSGDGDDHIESGTILTYTDNPLVVQERIEDEGTVSKHQHQRVVEEKDLLTDEIYELKKKQRAHESEMDAVRAELTEMKAKL